VSSAPQRRRRAVGGVGERDDAGGKVADSSAERGAAARGERGDGVGAVDNGAATALERSAHARGEVGDGIGERGGCRVTPKPMRSSVFFLQ
jgi:hypothetical protein